METNPSTLTSVPVNSSEIAEVNTALALSDSYVESATSKLAQIVSVIGGEGVKTYGVTGKNITKIMALVGAVVSTRYIYEKAGKHKWPLLGSVVALYLARVQFADKQSQAFTPKV